MVKNQFACQDCGNPECPLYLVLLKLHCPLEYAIASSKCPGKPVNTCGNGGCGHDTAHCTCPNLT